MRTCECVSFQLGTFGHYRDKSENRKGGSIKQDEGKTTTVPLPVSEGGRKQQIFEEFKSESSLSKVHITGTLDSPLFDIEAKLLRQYFLSFKTNIRQICFFFPPFPTHALFSSFLGGQDNEQVTSASVWLFIGLWTLLLG